MIAHLARRVGVALAFALAGCTDATGANGPGMAELSLFNALADGDIPLVKLDGVRLTLPASGGKLSLSVSAGPHHLELRNGAGAVLATTDFAAPSGTSESLMIVRPGAMVLRMLVLRDTASLPAPTAIKVRTIHAADDSGALRGWLRINGTPRDGSALVSDQFDEGFGTDGRFAGYAMDAPGFHLATATSRATDEVLAEGGKHLAGGHIWFAVLVRSVDGALEFRLFRDK
ncbi:MAG: DUF4397 domain-containing protein [Gemmatimonadota bacterium]